MTTITQTISTNPYISEGDYFILYDEITIKGGTSIKLDLLNVDESIFKVKYLNIDWGDGTTEKHRFNIFLDYYNESIIPEVLYNKQGSVCLEYTHSFNSDQSAYFTLYYISVTMLYFNGIVGKVTIPVKVSKPSMYDRVGELKLINNQILPLSSSNTLLNIQTEKEFFVIPMITNATNN